MKKNNNFLNYLLTLLVGLTIGFYIGVQPKAAPTEDDHHGDHSHSDHTHERFDFPLDAAAPSVNVEVEKNPEDGWDLSFDIQNFNLIPESSSTHGISDGHMHLYLNGQKLGRVYNTSFHLPSAWVDEGQENEIMVTISGHDHLEYFLDGKLINSIKELN